MRPPSPRVEEHRLHDKPVILLNAAGFYDGLAIQLRRMEEDGFLLVPLTELVFFADEGAAGDYQETMQNNRVIRAKFSAGRGPPTSRSPSCAVGDVAEAASASGPRSTNAGGWLIQPPRDRRSGLARVAGLVAVHRVVLFATLPGGRRVVVDDRGRLGE